MNDIKDMTNDEFISHLMTGYNKHGALVQMVILDCLQRGLDHYISHKDELLAEDARIREQGKISLINHEAWVSCCEETKQRIERQVLMDKQLINYDKCHKCGGVGIFLGY